MMTDLKSDQGFLRFIKKILDNDSITIKIRNLEQAQRIAKYLANLPQPPKDPKSNQEQNSPMMVEMAINELLINSIEHGLLKINYNDKTRLLAENAWDTYVNSELSKLAEDKFITVTCNIRQNNIEVNIADPGDGFDVSKYEK
jgi:hypothetical protein